MTIINVNEAAKLLNCKPLTIRRNIAKGYYPKGVIGRHNRIWLFDSEELLKFVFSS